MDRKKKDVGEAQNSAGGVMWQRTEKRAGSRMCEVLSHGGDFGPELGSRESLEVFKPACGGPMSNVGCGNFPLAGPWI